MNSLLKSLVKASGDPYASVASEGIVGESGNFSISTGNYALNALISGSIYEGMTSSRRCMFAGKSSSAKSFFAVSLMKTFLKDNPKGICVYLDSEFALTSKMLKERNIDVSRVVVLQPSTVEEMRQSVSSILDEYEKHHDPKSKEAPENKLMFILDSLGQLSTEAETSMASDAKKNTMDMGRKAQLLKSAFRVNGLRVARLNIPFVIIGQVYDSIGGMPGQVTIGGGSAAVYISDTIITLSKSQEKEGTEHTGVNILCTAFKSRMTKEKTQVRVKLLFDKGLVKHSGLLEIAEKAGIFEKVGNKYSVPIPECEGKTYFGKAINKNPDKFFTKEILDQINEWTMENFTFGSTEEEYDDESD